MIKAILTNTSSLCGWEIDKNVDSRKSPKILMFGNLTIASLIQRQLRYTVVDFSIITESLKGNK